jgi:hypothetical protein
MAATVPSPESRARIERLSTALLATISRFIQAEGATPPEVQTAAGHMFTTLICHLGAQDGRSHAGIQAQAEHVARLLMQDVRRKLPHYPPTP